MVATYLMGHSARDRQPYLTMNGVDDGWTPSQKLQSRGSMIKKWDQIAKNFWINGYNGVWTIDHDDGSQFMVQQQHQVHFVYIAAWLAPGK